MNKKALRQYYLEKRSAFSEGEIQQMSSGIFAQIKQLDWDEFNCFHLFQSIPKKNEVQTQEILRYLWMLNKKVVVPQLIGTEMISCQVDEKTVWTKGKFNVPEPENCLTIPSSEIDVVFVPMLICDEKGNRIGYGGGYYDRFLSLCNPKTLKIGLNFFAPISTIEEVEEFDIPLDYLVTPDEVVSFTADLSKKFIK